MSHRRGATTLLIIKYGEHAMAGQIIRVQLEKMLENRNARSIPLVIFDLRGPLQRRNLVWREFEGASKRAERFLLLTHPVVCDTLHRPKLRVGGRLLKTDAEHTKCFVVLVL